MTLSKWNLENKMSNLLRLVACLFLCVSLNSFGALYDRGNGLIYDDILNITWLQVLIILLHPVMRQLMP